MQHGVPRWKAGALLAHVRAQEAGHADPTGAPAAASASRWGRAAGLRTSPVEAAGRPCTNCCRAGGCDASPAAARARTLTALRRLRPPMCARHSALRPAPVPDPCPSPADPAALSGDMRALRQVLYKLHNEEKRRAAEGERAPPRPAWGPGQAGAAGCGAVPPALAALAGSASSGSSSSCCLRTQRSRQLTRGEPATPRTADPKWAKDVGHLITRWTERFGLQPAAADSKPPPL